MDEASSMQRERGDGEEGVDTKLPINATNLHINTREYLVCDRLTFPWPTHKRHISPSP